jgi:hypothetical protein
MAKVTITIEDIDNIGHLHGNIDVAKDQADRELPTVAERIGLLLFVSFKQGTIPGLEPSGFEVLPIQMQ